jgi:hypothetical protein
MVNTNFPSVNVRNTCGRTSGNKKSYIWSKSTYPETDKMTDATVAPAPLSPARSRGLIGRVLGVLTSPRATYADVAARPRWLGALAFVLFMNIGASLVFFSTPVGQQAALDQQLRTMESFGGRMSDARYEQMQRAAPYIGTLAAAGQLLSVPLVTLILAGLTFAVLTAGMGGNATFKQVYAVVVHSGFLIVLQQLFVLPLDYARQTLTSPTNLAVFLPFLDENTFVARLFGGIDLFIIWWVMSLAIGLGVLYKRRTTPIAATLFVVYGVLALALAAIRTALAGA